MQNQTNSLIDLDLLWKKTFGTSVPQTYSPKTVVKNGGLGV